MPGRPRDADGRGAAQVLDPGIPARRPAGARLPAGPRDDPRRELRRLQGHQRPAGFPRRTVLSPWRVARARPGRGLRHPVPLPRVEVRRGRDHHGDPQPRHTHVQAAGQARGLPGARGRRARLGLPRAAGDRAAVPRVRLVRRRPGRAPRDRDDHGLQLDAGARGLDRLLARGHLASGHARHDGSRPAQRRLVRLRRGTVGPGHAGTRTRRAERSRPRF